MSEAAVFRCPRCRAEMLLRPCQGDEIVAAYCLCAGAVDPRRRGGDPVRMERAAEPEAVPA